MTGIDNAVMTMTACHALECNWPLQINAAQCRGTRGAGDAQTPDPRLRQRMLVGLKTILQ